MYNTIKTIMIGILIGIILAGYYGFNKAIIEKNFVNLQLKNFKKEIKKQNNLIENYKKIIKDIETIKKEEIKKTKNKQTKTIKIIIENYSNYIDKINDWITYGKMWKPKKIKQWLITQLKEKKYYKIIVFIDNKKQVLNCIYNNIDKIKGYNFYKDEIEKIQKCKDKKLELNYNYVLLLKQDKKKPSIKINVYSDYKIINKIIKEYENFLKNKDDKKK